jgi:hypothetical protein
VKARARLTPYVLLGVLTLGTGLGIGLGLSEASTSAVVTGVAEPCIGVTTTAQYARVPVDVTVKEGARTIASETVTGSHTYRFVLPAAPYMVYSDQFQRPSFVPAVLHSGETDQVNLVPNCK